MLYPSEFIQPAYNMLAFDHYKNKGFKTQAGNSVK